MTLSKWLERNCLTHEEFADMCGCTRAAVTRWVSGSRLPHPKWLKVIHLKTKGQVTMFRQGQNDRERAFILLYTRGFTVEAAAKKLRIHRNTLSKFFRGQAQTPPEIVSRIYKLAGLE